ncbi:hypothetical protein QTO34_000560 [Cnephaeus nilssonii]|uniref:Uncharacterized protein n=1 Tax=Cnephaeus nilssonii TaxID=3371016 RepID=A0AA40ICQ3_CNENI|nr:hypothetical protein QTO34_000560 [Eptesicus nilssonii]
MSVLTFSCVFEIVVAGCRDKEKEVRRNKRNQTKAMKIEKVIAATLQETNKGHKSGPGTVGTDFPLAPGTQASLWSLAGTQVLGFPHSPSFIRKEAWGCGGPEGGGLAVVAGEQALVCLGGRVMPPFVFTHGGSMYYDEDGNLPHEFYEETIITKNGPKWANLRRVHKNLIPQGTVKLDMPRIHVNFPVILYEKEQRSQFVCQSITCITTMDPEKLFVPSFKRLKVAPMTAKLKRKMTKAIQKMEVATWGQLKKLTEAQQMIEKQDVEATPSMMFLAMLALGDKLLTTLNYSFWGHAGNPDAYGEKLDSRPSVGE